MVFVHALFRDVGIAAQITISTVISTSCSRRSGPHWPDTSNVTNDNQLGQHNAQYDSPPAPPRHSICSRTAICLRHRAKRQQPPQSSEPTKKAALAAPSISVLVAQKGKIAENLNVTGSFAAGELVLVTPEVEGFAVTDLLAEEGDTVKKGQVLARLSSLQVEIQIAQTKASLARNDAAVAQAQNQIEQSPDHRGTGKGRSRPHRKTPHQRCQLC